MSIEVAKVVDRCHIDEIQNNHNPSALRDDFAEGLVSQDEILPVVPPGINTDEPVVACESYPIPRFSGRGR